MLASHEHAEVVLDAEDARIVTLEGIAVLVRLSTSAAANDVRLVVERPHPVLERKLAVTGVRDFVIRPG